MNCNLRVHDNLCHKVLSFLARADVHICTKALQVAMRTLTAIQMRVAWLHYAEMKGCTHVGPGASFAQHSMQLMQLFPAALRTRVVQIGSCSQGDARATCL